MGRYLQLSIGDTQEGIPKKIPERMFRFFPGLSFVQGMVREMGGAISVCNEPEEGTIFHVLFPKYEKESDEESNGSIIDY